jgi:hypothetical protein
MSNLLSCSLALLLAANAAAPRGNVLECGDWHGNEVTPRMGERWLGFVHDCNDLADGRMRRPSLWFTTLWSTDPGKRCGD